MSNEPSLSVVKALRCGAVYTFVSSVLGTAASKVTAPEDTAKSALANDAMPFALVLASDTATVAVPLEYPTLTGDVPATITAPFALAVPSSALIVTVSVAPTTVVIEFPPAISTVLPSATV